MPPASNPFRFGLLFFAKAAVLILVAAGVAWWKLGQSPLTWRLQTLANQALLGDELESLDDARAYNEFAGVIATNAAVADQLKLIEAEELIAAIETDRSAPRRMAAATVLLRRLEKTVGPNGPAPAVVEDLFALQTRLARLAVRDDSRNVRAIFRRLIQEIDWPADAIAEMIESVREVEASQSADLLLSLSYRKRYQKLSSANSVAERSLLPSIPSSGPNATLPPPMSDAVVAVTPALQRALLKVVQRAEPKFALLALSALMEKGALPPGFEPPNELFEAISFEGLEPAHRRSFAQILVRFSPERAKGLLQNPGEGAAEILSSACQSRELAVHFGLDALANAGVEALKLDEERGTSDFRRLLSHSPECIFYLADFLEKQPEKVKTELIDRLNKLRIDAPAANPRPEVLNALVKIIHEKSYGTAEWAAGYLSQRGVDRKLKWSEDDRRRFQARFHQMNPDIVSKHQVLWGFLWRAATQKGMAESDLVYVENMLRSPGATDKGEFQSANELFELYRQQAPKERSDRVLEEVCRKAGSPASRTKLSAIRMLTKDPAALAKIKGPLYASLPALTQPNPTSTLVVSARDFVRDSTFARAYFRLLEHQHPPPNRADLASIWDLWIVEFPATSYGSPPNQTPSLADARKLIPPDIAASGVQRQVRLAFWAPTPEPTIDSPEGDPAFLNVVLSDALKSMPEFTPTFEACVRDDLQSRNAWRRLRGYRVANRHAVERRLVVETIEVLLQDEHPRPLREALQWINTYNVGSISPAARLRIRQLCKEPGDPSVQSAALFTLMDLPDRSENDFDIVQELEKSDNEKIIWAVRYAKKNWQRK